jgi:hypothetical protein
MRLRTTEYSNGIGRDLAAHGFTTCAAIPAPCPPINPVPTGGPRLAHPEL